MADVERAVIISHTIDEESNEPVNQIDNELQRRGIRVIHDIHDYGNKRSIELFMKHIEQGNSVILVISDKYLREPRSMFVVVEIANNRRTYDRVFPVVLADANIFEPVQRLEYVKYWEEKRAELTQAIKTSDPANLQDVRDDMDLYEQIRDVISRLTVILKDMNTLTPELHQGNDFSQLYDAIEKRMGLGDQPTNVQTNDNSVAVGRIEVGGTVGGAVTIGRDIYDTFPHYQVRVITQLNIRGGPGISFPVVGQLKEGDEAEITKEQTDESWQLWGEIATDEWISLSNSTVVKLSIKGQSEEPRSDEDTSATKDSLETEDTRRLQAAIEANLLANNRSQAVFNDKAQGEDQLGIKNEVEALAETLLLRDVEPPVAVGVMGGWGSGKSFVIYLIDQYVQRIRAQRVKKGWADSDEKDPKIPVFVGHVYQIHFNAWTYAKSNLWASLMDTIFSCLNRQMQLERLLAHREFSPEKPPAKEQIYASMMAGGDEFKKIYLDNPQLGQDKDLEKWHKNLEHWSQHLLKGTLLWNIMRGQQVETLEKLKDTEEQLNQLKARREQFEKERPLNEITVKDLDPTARKAYLQSIKSFTLAFLSDQLSTAAKDELKKHDVKEEDIQKHLDEAKGLWGGVKTVVTAFRRSKLYLIWTLIFFALTFALPYVWNAYDLEFVQLQMAKIISWFLTLLPTLAILLPWVKKSIEASVEAKKILEGAYIAQQAKHAEEIANSTDMPLPQKISALQADISKGSVAAYDALIGLLEAQAEEQRQKIGPSAKYSNLMEFVQSRLDAATYENQLGLMHQVRQDIDELTFSLVDNTSPDVFPRGKPRVILYIDDLDRCPPPRVVEMLEAVQLLLNTKLFIVILGLDTRYVTRALEKEYKEILQHEGDPSGLDYIEKIIQIPYRVRAIEKDNLRLYIEKQMDIEKAPEPEPAAPNTLPMQTGVEQDTQPAEEQPVQQQPIPEQLIQDQSADEAKASSQPASQEPVLPPIGSIPPKPLEIELPAAVIQFKQEDLDDLAVCCHKIVLTPRSIKRLVNVFKLMKIFWFRADKDAGIAERDRPRAVKQAAMTLLALSSAYPEVMREVFVHLDVLYRQGQEKTELFTALGNIKLPPGSANELSWQLQKYKADINALKAIVGNGQDKFGQLALQDLKLSTFNIVRSFSFVGDPVYWADGEDELAASNGQHPQPTKAKRNSTRK